MQIYKIETKNKNHFLLLDFLKFFILRFSFFCSFLINVNDISGKKERESWPDEFVMIKWIINNNKRKLRWNRNRAKNYDENIEIEKTKHRFYRTFHLFWKESNLNFWEISFFWITWKTKPEKFSATIFYILFFQFVIVNHVIY